MTLTVIGGLGLGFLLVISALEGVSLVQVWHDILAGKPLYSKQTTTATATPTATGSLGSGAGGPAIHQ